MKIPLFLFLGLAACASETGAAGDPSSEGVVSGRVLDSAGHAIAGAEIVVNNSVWFDQNIVLSSDADGKFRYEMPPTGSWYVRGTISRAYHGQTYVVPLRPSPDGAFAGKDGAVVNLTWTLTGAVPTSFGGAGFYGGTVVANNYTFDDIDLSQIELTLEPTDALIDGTTGRTIARKLVQGADGYIVEDVPIGSYRISAKYLVTGQPMKVRHRRAPEDSDSVTLDFEPSYPGATAYAIPLAVAL